MLNHNGSLCHKIYRKNSETVTRKITGELFVIPVKGKLADMQRIFTMNPVAELIWNQLDGRTSIGDIRSRVMSVYNVKEDQVDVDIAEFISELLSADLISE